MNHAYLTKKDIDVARIIKQITAQEVSELKKVLDKCTKHAQVAKIILDRVI